MAQVSPGVKIRAQIDSEVVRGLLLANGGGAVALLAFLPKVLTTERLGPLELPVVIGLFVFHLGIVAAIVHTNYRRQCSLIYEQYNFSPPAGTFLGCNLGEPGVCFTSKFLMWASVICFLAGGCAVFLGALRIICP